jgi:hypothetical protein
VTSPRAERLLGLFFLALAIVIVLPIPFGNMLPAVAVFIISLGLIEADGLLVILGAIVALSILVIMTGAILALFSEGIAFLTRHI